MQVYLMTQLLIRILCYFFVVQRLYQLLDFSNFQINVPPTSVPRLFTWNAHTRVKRKGLIDPFVWPKHEWEYQSNLKRNIKRQIVESFSRGRTRVKSDEADRTTWSESIFTLIVVPVLSVSLAKSPSRTCGRVFLDNYRKPLGLGRDQCSRSQWQTFPKWKKQSLRSRK